MCKFSCGSLTSDKHIVKLLSVFCTTSAVASKNGNNLNKKLIQQFSSQWSGCVKGSSLHLFNCLRNNPSKSVRAGPGQAGLVHHGYRLYGIKDAFFSIIHIEKIDSLRGIVLFEGPYMSVENLLDCKVTTIQSLQILLAQT